VPGVRGGNLDVISITLNVPHLLRSQTTYAVVRYTTHRPIITVIYIIVRLLTGGEITITYAANQNNQTIDIAMFIDVTIAIWD
jgi:hypothetical protein